MLALGLVAVGLVSIVGSGAARGRGPNQSRIDRSSDGVVSRDSEAITMSPLRTRAVQKLVASAQGQVTAAVEDLKTHQEWLLNRGNRDQTASIVKADILETLLHQSGRTAAGLASVETDTAEDMIEESDNDDATDLWDQVGGASGIAAYNRLAGLTDTTPNPEAWGETLTTAADQIKLLRQLALPSKILTRADQRYQLYLMRHVVGYEDWGVNGGVPANVSVALKNGWVPLSSDTDWEVNSIGWVDGDGHDYLIAVLTAHDPSEQYGISLIDGIAGDVYRSLPGRADLKRKPHRGQSTG